MSNEGFKLQASVKDADGDMVNVRADSPEELKSYLENFDVGAYAQFKANVRGGQALGGIVQPQAAPVAAAPAPWDQQPYNGQQGPAPTWATGAPQAAPAPVQYGGPQNGQPHPEGIRCQLEGNVVQFKKTAPRRSDGKSFEFWTCPNQKSKDDGHYSEFAN